MIRKCPGFKKSKPHNQIWCMKSIFIYEDCKRCNWVVIIVAGTLRINEGWVEWQLQREGGHKSLLSLDCIRIIDHIIPSPKYSCFEQTIIHLEQVFTRRLFIFKRLIWMNISSLKTDVIFPEFLEFSMLCQFEFSS